MNNKNDDSKTPLELFIEKLKLEPKYISNEGTVLKNVVLDAVYQNDKELIQMIREIPQLHSEYFTVLDDGTEIFNQIKFEWLVSNREFLPDSYTRFANKIGLVQQIDRYNQVQLSQIDDVVLTFPYKDCVLEGDQSKTNVKHDEIFYNTTLSPDKIDCLLSPKVLSKPVKYSKFGISNVSEYNGENLIIRGNNLLALHSISNRFEGKIRCIYIDPPYYFYANKSEDTFLYNSNFKLSTWLVFMKNRLEIAKKLLSEDGAIFVQISDDGVAELHLLMKEIFGPSNFINKITVKTRSPSGFASVNPGVFESAEYILSFAKNKKQWRSKDIYEKSDYDAQYKWVIRNRDMPCDSWEIEDIGDVVAEINGFDNRKNAIETLGQDIFERKIADYAQRNARLVFRFTQIGNNAGSDTVEIRENSKEEPNKIFKLERQDKYTRYIKNGQEITFYSRKIRKIDGEEVPSIQISNIWTDTPYEGIAKEGNVTLKGGKKPEKLIKRIIEMSTEENDIVLDFFAGSGTTCAVAHKMNRRYIGIEQLEYGENDCLVRMKNVIDGDQSGISKTVGWSSGGSFVYCELMKLNQAFIDRLLECKDEDLTQLYTDVVSYAYINSELNSRDLLQSVDDFNNLLPVDKRRLIKDILDMNMLYVNLSDLNDSDLDISEAEKSFNSSFYG